MQVNALKWQKVCNILFLWVTNLQKESSSPIREGFQGHFLIIQTLAGPEGAKCGVPTLTRTPPPFLQVRPFICRQYTSNRIHLFIIPCMGLTQKRFKRVPCDFKERRANQTYWAARLQVQLVLSHVNDLFI